MTEYVGKLALIEAHVTWRALVSILGTISGLRLVKHWSSLYVLYLLEVRHRRLETYRKASGAFHPTSEIS